MTAAARRDWRVILLAVVAGAGALLCLGLAAALSGYTLLAPLLSPMTVIDRPTDAGTGVFVLAGGMGLIAAVLTATLVFSFRALGGHAERQMAVAPMRWWEVLFWSAAWLGASTLAQFLYRSRVAEWAIPILHLTAIAVPIYVLARLAIAGIQSGSRLRLWGSVTAGMLLGTGLAAAIEILLVLAAAAAGVVYLIANPEHLVSLQRLAIQLEGVVKPEDAIGIVGPLFTSPVTLALALGAVAVATPIIEELAKSLPVWIVHDRVVRGADGFWAGALAGAGFALLEGIMVSADAGESLAFILVLRAGSSLMHIVASGLAGWGIGLFRATGKISRVMAGYAAAMAVHALWNGVVVAIGYGGIRSAYAVTQPDLIGMVLSIGGGMLLMALIGLLPIGLVALNLRLRTAPNQAASSPASDSQLATVSDTKDEAP